MGDAAPVAHGAADPEAFLITGARGAVLLPSQRDERQAVERRGHDAAIACRTADALQLLVERPRLVDVAFMVGPISQRAEGGAYAGRVPQIARQIESLHEQGASSCAVPFVI